MVRKQIYIENRQDEVLKDRAEQLGVSEAELVRRAIDLAAGIIGQRRFRLPPDPSWWEREKEYIRKYRAGPVPQTTERGWSRDDLYDERLRKWNS